MPHESLERLKEGNARFVAGVPSRVRSDPARLREAARGQNPFAAVLACSDSRVPVEFVFDQGVGDLFVVRVGIVAPAGARVEFPPFSLIDPVEAADSLRVTRDSVGRWTATYSLRGWFPADSLVARLPFRLVRADGSRQDHAVRVQLPAIASVLPEDSALHEPRPAKAVLPVSIPTTAGRAWLLPAGLLAALLLGAIALAIRGRRHYHPAPADPRDLALAELAAIEAQLLTGRGELDLYFVRTSRVLRRYLAQVAGLGEDLTSSELLRIAATEGLPGEAMGDLRSLLRAADRVKFAGAAAAADPEAARSYGAALRHWVQRWPPVSDTDGREAAA